MFIVGAPAEQENFIDRKIELNNLLNFLKDSQSVMIHAPRRYGKTSLITEGFRQYNKDTLYFDLRRYADCGELGKDILEKVYNLFEITNFWQRVKQNLALLIRSIRATINIKVFDIVDISIEKITELEKENNKDEIFLCALETIEKITTISNRSIKIAFDEFQDLCTSLTNNKDILAKMRAVIQHQKNITYIFLGSHQSLMHKIFENNSSPFFHFCRVIELGCLDKNELFNFGKQQFKHLGCRVDNELLECLLLLDCHPYNSMKVMQILYYMILEYKITELDKQHYHKAISSAIYETKNYLDELVSQVKNKAHHFDILLSIALGNKTNFDTATLYRVKQSLVTSGYLFHRGKDNYSFCDSLLRLYLQNY